MKTGSARSAAFLWLGLVLTVALAIAFLLPVNPNDYWWYLRLGCDITTTGAVPQVDAFTFTQTGEAVVYHSWGAALVFWWVYAWGGLTLTVLLRGVVVVLTYGLVWQTGRQMGAGRLGAVLVVLVAVLASSNNWSLRPQLLAYPLFALGLAILVGWTAGKRRGLVILPLLSLLWVNLHGSFVLLILLCGAALAFGRGDRKALALAFGGALLATFVNPRGAGSWGYVLNSLTSASSQVFSAEWLPPMNDHWQMNLFFLWLLVFPLLVARVERKMSALEWAWFLGFGFLALWGERYVIWFILVLATLTAGLLAGWEKKVLGEPKPGSALVNFGLAGVLMLMTVSLLPGVRGLWWPKAPPATENTPVAAVEWLADHPEMPSPLWSEIGFSSYLEFAMPERQTWIDTRFEVFPVEQWQDYRAITQARHDWPDLLAASGVQLLMVSVEAQPDLAVALSEAGGWCLRYGDDVALIYALCEGAE